MKRNLILAVLTSIAILRCVDYAGALPPLGLTHVGSLSSGNLEIIEGTAYIGEDGTVSQVDSGGNITVTNLVHPQFGAPNKVTRVVAGPDGMLYVGANFGPTDPFLQPNHSALFRLDAPTVPVVTWERQVDLDTVSRPWIVGVDRSLRVVGNMDQPSKTLDTSPAEFHLDGSVEFLEYPRGASPAYITHVSASGHALGQASVPGTFSGGVALWSPDGTFSFVSGFGVAGSFRDRLDGDGVNIGYEAGDTIIKYGELPSIFINVRGNRVIVSHSDFALVGTDASGVSQTEEYFAFFPGIVPEDPTQTVPLFDVFPELASVNLDRITDLAAVDGRIYMTLHGEDGLYLFGARDPPVIPEPSTFVVSLLVAGTGGWLARLRLRRKRRVDMATA